MPLKQLITKAYSLFTSKKLQTQYPFYQKRYPRIQIIKPTLTKIAQKTPEPFFVTVLDSISKNYLLLQKSMQKWFKNQGAIYFSFKTNYEVAASGWLTKNHIGAEVVSWNEYQLAKRYLFDDAQILYNGPYKTISDIKNALTAGVRVNIDTQAQVNHLISLQKNGHDFSTSQHIGIRIKTTADSRFGFSTKNGEALHIIKTLYKQKIPVSLLHHHAGTDIYSPKTRFYQATDIAAFIDSLPSNVKNNLTHIDVGGGFPAHIKYPYYQKPTPDDSISINDHIKAIAKGLRHHATTKQIIVEPGRWLVENAVLYVTTVIDTAKEDIQKIIVNGAISHLPVAYYRPQVIQAYSSGFTKKSNHNLINSIIYGSTCKEDDILFQGFLPNMTINDHVIFYAVGAYNQSMQTSQFIFREAKGYFINS